MSYVNESEQEQNMVQWLNAQVALEISSENMDNYIFHDYIRMSVNRTANYTVFHSVGKHNQGYIKLPRSITFSVTIPVTAADANVMRGLYNGEKIFDFDYYDLKSTGKSATQEFKLVREKLHDCILTAMNDSYEVEGVPNLVFNGTALRNSFVATVNESSTMEFEFGTNDEKLTMEDFPTLVEDDYWDTSQPSA